MGIESEQLVYDYLGKVGDLAQSSGLSSGERMRLVTEVRADIERQRSGAAGDSPAAVRRILARLGTPAEVVAAAGDGGGYRSAGEPGAGPYVPGAGTGVGGSGGRSGGEGGDTGSARERLAGIAERAGLTGLTGKLPSPREGRASLTKTPRRSKPPRSSEPPPPPTASPPHLAGEDELGPRESDPDWWQVGVGPFWQEGGPQAGQVDGFVGGIEMPELLRPPPEEDEGVENDDEAGDEAVEDDESAAGSGRRGLLRRRRIKDDGEGGGLAQSLPAPVLLLAIALLVAGAALGNIIVLGFGWLIAYISRKLSRAEAKWAVLGMPGLVVAGAGVWVWGRARGRWGERIPDDGMSDVLSETWPVVVRVAAVATALFLLWRGKPRS